MANKPLKSIKFPGLGDTYTVPQVDNTLSVTGAAADAKKTGDEISELNERLSTLTTAIAPNIKLVDVSSYYNVIPKSMLSVSLVVDDTIKDHTFYISNYGITGGKFYFNILDVTANSAFINYNINTTDISGDTLYIFKAVNTAYLIARVNVSIINRYWNSYTDARHIELMPESFKDFIRENRSMLYEPTLITTDYATRLPDLNDVTDNISYRINIASGSTSFPANSPYTGTWNSTNVVIFESEVSVHGSHTPGDKQLFFASDGIYARHFQITTWTDWLLIANKQGGEIITVDANGSGDYTSLCEGIFAGLLKENITVLVKQGIYDTIAEMKAIKGNDYFANMTTNASGMIYLQNGIKIICEPGTEMVCEYTGDNGVVNENVNKYFSPINFRRGEATIEGLTIKAKNTRYCIHDDQWDSTIPYRHILKNCTLIVDNSENANWDRRLAYGGGLGVHGYIEFDGCYFKSVGLDGTTAYSGWGTCGFHNSPAANAQSRIVVKNCYFADTSTFRLTYMGSSTKITTAFVSGCSLGRAMELEAESVSATIQNCEIIDCNNSIRTA